jgi:hypothetical protein
MKMLIIKRIREYGNQRELAEITRFCGENEVDEIFSRIKL